MTNNTDEKTEKESRLNLICCLCTTKIDFKKHEPFTSSHYENIGYPELDGFAHTRCYDKKYGEQKWQKNL